MRDSLKDWACAIILLAVGFPAASLAQETAPVRRVWKDRTGKFRVEATLEGSTATAVQLRRADNDKVIEVPLNRLSEEDLEFLRKADPDTFAKPESTIKTAAELEAAAQKRRYALGALVMYKAFLADPSVAEVQKNAAQGAFERWKPLAASAKVKCGTKWYTPAEYADLEDDERALLEQAERQLESNDAKGVGKTLEQASKLNPASIQANFRLGILCALHPRSLSSNDAEKQFEECVRRLQNYSGDWTEIDKANLGACYNNLALTLIRQRKLGLALGCWEKSIRHGTPPAELAHNIGHLRTLLRGTRGGLNSLYLSDAERDRLERISSKLTLNPQSYDPSRGWRYARMAKTPIPEPAASADPAVAPQPVPNLASLVTIGSGSGFVIGKNHVATNRHVVEAGRAFKIRFEGEDEAAARIATVDLVSTDRKIDLAALRCADLPAPALSFNGTLPKLSEELRVLGFPLGSDLGSNVKVSRGIVSSLPPQRNIPDLSLAGAIFHDAASYGGSSGGPVSDQDGTIIGVHFAALRDMNQLKACVAAADAISFFRPRVPDLVIFTRAPASQRLAWEVAVENVRKSTVQVIMLAEPDRFDPIEKDLGKTFWDPHDDPWCLACYGRNHLDCPVRNCTRGGVPSVRRNVVVDGNGTTGRVILTPIRIKCEHCDGVGRVNCGYCEYGFDPRFVNAANQAWLMRYLALLKTIGATDD